MKKITTIPKLYRYIQTNYNNQKFLNFPMDNKWIHYSTANFCNTVKHLALGWQALGLKKNDKVGIISDSSPYWVIMDMAVIIAGGITVPLFANISKQHMQYEIKDSKMKYFFYDHEYKHKLFSGLKKNFKKIISLYNDKKHRRSKKIICWDKLIKLGEKTAARKKKLFTNLCNKIKPQDTVTIIYTSGSTGDPKGVELSNRNITSQFYACFDRLPVWETDRCVSTLPLAHIFERTIAYYYMSSGASIYFCDSYKNVGSIMKERQPTVMTVVPRLLDAVYTKMKNKILHGSMLKKMIALPAFRKAEKHPVEQTGKRVANLLYKNMVYKKLNAALGGKLRMLISGGAALPDKLGRFFVNIGVPLLQGYGLTETSPVLATNAPDLNKIGSVGKPLKTVKIKISSKGEILAKGYNIMKGYYKRKKDTSKVIDKAGWFHTGDCGYLDKDGYLFIKSRIKDMYKTTSGKYITPTPIEEKLRELDIIEFAILIADNRKFVSALLFPDYEKINEMQSAHNKTGKTAAFLESDPVQNKIKNHIQTVNSGLDEWAKINKYKLLNKTITIEGGDLTPSMKIRRHIIQQKYQKEIERFYK